MKQILFCISSWLRSASFAKFGLLAGVSCLLFGCPASKSERPNQGAAGGGSKVVIRGSNTFGEELGPDLIAKFNQQQPAITFNLDTKGTGYGLAALRIGQCDIAAASRAAIQADHELARESGIELKDTVLGAYSVAVVVNANNPVSNLTKDQVHDIFTGKITNWKEVGGPDATIALYIRDPISGTHLGFKEVAMKNEAYAAHPHLHTNYTAIVQAVVADTNGIGYSGIEQAKAPGAKTISIDDVAPSTETVNNGKYPYARTLRFYTNKGNETQATKDFIQFVLSKEGQALMSQLGFTPRS